MGGLPAMLGPFPGICAHNPLPSCWRLHWTTPHRLLGRLFLLSAEACFLQGKVTFCTQLLTELEPLLASMVELPQGAECMWGGGLLHPGAS